MSIRPNEKELNFAKFFSRYKFRIRIIISFEIKLCPDKAVPDKNPKLQNFPRQKSPRQGSPRQSSPRKADKIDIKRIVNTIYKQLARTIYELSF